ncbi:hypothetical protein F8M41_025593 [Gigaspora margarita]|uniref:Uncharacterized protein n=1 Tax=Gigaspora margarita TaxID=4874 RepID=A0A8H3XJY8_GIGMA|nr:hypothetical protein F8M41_025593 [Gigaspora margarita]
MPMLPNAGASLSNLVKFMPKGVDDDTYEQYYSKICRKIKTFKLQDLNTGNLGAISLIMSQFSLEHIMIDNHINGANNVNNVNNVNIVKNEIKNLMMELDV